MLNKELIVLSHISTRPDSSQRELAMTTGISLGQTNLMIKKLSDDGLIRQDSISKRKKRYVLTQRGIAERTRYSNETILAAIRSYRRIKGAVLSLLNRLYGQGYREFVLEGERGEIHEVVSEVFDDHFRDRASLIWGPAEMKEGQVLLNLDRRFLNSKDTVNILHEINL